MSSGSEDSEVDGWIRWHCRLEGNEFLCEVDRAYIEDAFNLYGLRACVPHFQECLDIILDRIDLDELEDPTVMNALAAQLYGLIHARFIVTSHGLSVMHSKYRQSDFGCCSRVLCCGQSVVPFGSSTDLGHDYVSIFCPKCGELYLTGGLTAGAGGHQSTHLRPLDGAYFGPTFAHLFFMAYSNEAPQEPPQRYEPRVFGFRVNATSESIAHLTRGREDSAAALSAGPGDPAGSTEGGTEVGTAGGTAGHQASAAATTRPSDPVAVVPDRHRNRGLALGKSGSGAAKGSTISKKDRRSGSGDKGIGGKWDSGVVKSAQVTSSRGRPDEEQNGGISKRLRTSTEPSGKSLAGGVTPAHMAPSAAAGSGAAGRTVREGA